MDGPTISCPRGPLADFLTARRAAVTAAEHSLPEPACPRRVPGLRREEVAQLAGISTDYYSRLEQGRIRTASRMVLAAIARAREAVSSLRMAAGAYPDQPRLQELVGELSVRDADFRTWWSQHLVTLHPFGHSTVQHPIAGRFNLDWQVLTTVDDHEQAIVLITTPPGSPDHTAIQRLASWADKQALQPSHPVPH